MTDVTPEETVMPRKRPAQLRRHTPPLPPIEVGRHPDHDKCGTCGRLRRSHHTDPPGGAPGPKDGGTCRQFTLSGPQPDPAA